MTVRNNAGVVTGTYTGGATAFIGPTVAIGGTVKRVESLAAHVVPNLTTASLALSVKWQASFDGTAWFDVASAPQNPAAVAFATGPVGPGSSGKIVPAPDAVYGQKYARAVIAAASATGAGTDVVALGYDYRQLP